MAKEREAEREREGVALIGRCSHYRVKYFRRYLANSQRSHHTQLDRDLLKGLPALLQGVQYTRFDFDCFSLFLGLVAHLQLPIGLFISCNFNLPLFAVGSVNFFLSTWRLKLVYGLRSYKNVAIAQNWVKIVRQPSSGRAVAVCVLLLLLLLLLPVAD